MKLFIRKIKHSCAIFGTEARIVVLLESETMSEVDLYDYGRRFPGNLEMIEEDKRICEENKKELCPLPRCDWPRARVMAVWQKFSIA